eukprot:CAMPEP_0195518568 /NCGR_PEP_ID=MMETSP0794_2-20130614/13169_1 /TAXON_ID=515487 /ORGANISM="Stephanopyxis turris, Strain CCMP 815" /LENGTH=714 /DNA_ID=CAMNT_0040647561 /DNA_START=271 /DNA_END=2415 /DNA_ORIENTATION=-
MESWNAVCQWIESHQNRGSRRILEDAAHILDEHSITPLHAACRNCPPVDIIESLLGIASDTAAMSDAFGWLPLHYACGCGASEDVLRVLCEANPESKIFSDTRGRTPLHFALGNIARPVSPGVVELLAASGAAAHRNQDGMLPLHYACAYGISREALLVLIGAYPDCITGIDNKGRSPLHFACANAEKESSPSTVRILLDQNPTVIDKTDNDGKFPLDLLARQSQRLELHNKDGRENVVKCFLLCLNASKTYVPNLNQLPFWLRKEVQHVLVRKMSQPFPFAILMLDFYMYALLILSFSMATNMYIKPQLQSEHASVGIKGWFIGVIFLAIVYFVLREIMQIFSQKKAWFRDTWNCLDVANIMLVVISAIIMTTGNGAPDKVRILLMVTNGLVWIMMVRYLKSINQSFAIFVSAVIHIACKLSSFIIAIALIIVSFAQMYYIASTDACSTQNAPGGLTFCSLRDSCMKTLAMSISGIDKAGFTQNRTIAVLTVAYGLLVVILLLNVLIAVVNESYKDVRDEGKKYFQSNQVAFLAEVDALASFFHRKPLKKDETAPISYWDRFHKKIESWWDISIELFDDQELYYCGVECYLINFFRVFVLLLLLFWIILGLATLGLLWPQQVRSWKLNGKNDSEENDWGTKNTDNITIDMLNLIQKKDTNTDKNGNTLQQGLCGDEHCEEITKQLGEMKNAMENQKKDISAILELLMMQLTQS